MGLKDFLAQALSRGGDIVSRPGYAMGNAMEALAYQMDRPFLNDAQQDKVKQLFGETNPFKAVAGGLAGQDKVQPGDALGRAARFASTEGSMPGAVAGLFDNPITKFGLNLGTDPIAASGALGKGGAVTSKLGSIGQGEDAGRFAQTAGKLLGPKTLQNINTVSKFGDSNPAYVLPAAGLLGTGRKYIPAVDRLVERLYAAKGGVKAAEEGVEGIGSNLDDVGGALKELGPGVSTGPPVVNPLRPAINDLGTATEPFEAGRQVGEQLALGPGNKALGTGAPATPMGGMQGPAMEALGAGPSLPSAIGTGTGATRSLGMGPLALEGASGAGRMEALQKALGGRGIEAIQGSKGAGGRFLSKSVVSDAEQIRSLLNNPETRDQTLRMLMSMVQ